MTNIKALLWSCSGWSCGGIFQ